MKSVTYFTLVSNSGVLTLSGAQRRRLAVGARVGVRLDPALVHVMPLRAR